MEEERQRAVEAEMRREEDRRLQEKALKAVLKNQMEELKLRENEVSLI